MICENKQISETLDEVGKPFNKIMLTQYITRGSLIGDE